MRHMRLPPINFLIYGNFGLKRTKNMIVDILNSESGKLSYNSQVMNNSFGGLAEVNQK